VSKPIPASTLATVAFEERPPDRPRREVPEEEWADVAEHELTEADLAAKIEELRKDIRNLDYVYRKTRGRLGNDERAVMAKYGYRGSTLNKKNDEMDGWIQQQIAELKEQLRKMGVEVPEE
jgi:hypothetical protein